MGVVNYKDVLKGEQLFSGKNSWFRNFIQSTALCGTSVDLMHNSFSRHTSVAKFVIPSCWRGLSAGNMLSGVDYLHFRNVSNTATRFTQPDTDKPCIFVVEIVHAPDLTESGRTLML